MLRISVPLMGLLLFLYCCLGLAAMAEAEVDVKYKDPKHPMNARIKDLMNRMTLAEKIGQMVQVDRTVVTPEIVREYLIGSILSGGGSEPLPKANQLDWIKMVNHFQNASLSTRLGIPIIYGIDAVHGHNNVYKATIFPHNIGLGATGCCLGLAAMTEAEVQEVKYKDPKQLMNARIKDLMNRMTLAEKIGQMVQVDRTAVTPEIVREYSIGSILSGGGSEPLPKANQLDWIKMVNHFQNASLSTRLGIPIIYGIDAVHGHNNVYKATIFAHNIGLGATRDADLVKRIGAATAREVRATGINYAFSPCIAVCRDPRWGRCYESFSEDPNIVIQMTDIILGLQGEIPSDSPKGIPYVGGKDKVVACAKHFVGDGGTTKGINENNTVIDRHGLLSIHMPAYYHSIIKGVSTIMVSYSSWNGEKMHANRDLVNNFLKGTLKFRGFVISDWQGIDKITYPAHSNYSDSVLAGVQAGVDMIMVPYNYTEFIQILTDHVNNDKIPISRINDAVRRILRIKFTLGLFENPLADHTFVDQLGSQAHRDLAREAVRKSLVLLKNGENADNTLLPLPKNASRILVAGTHANNLGYQFGGWTIAWQGLSGNNHTAGNTILSGITAAVEPSTEVVYSENPDINFVKNNNFSVTGIDRYI